MARFKTKGRNRFFKRFGVYAAAMANGALSVRAPWVAKDAEGVVKLATVRTFGDTVITAIDIALRQG